MTKREFKEGDNVAYLRRRTPSAIFEGSIREPTHHEQFESFAGTIAGPSRDFGTGGTAWLVNFLGQAVPAWVYEDALECREPGRDAFGRPIDEPSEIGIDHSDGGDRTAEVRMYNGKGTDQGEHAIGREYPGEGYAILTCGGSTYRIGATALHNININFNPDEASYYFTWLCEFSDALDAMCAEAMSGNTPNVPRRRTVGDLAYAWHVTDQGFDYLYGNAEEAAATVLRRNNPDREDASPDEIRDATARLLRDDKLEVNGIEAKIRRIW